MRATRSVALSPCKAVPCVCNLSPNPCKVSPNPCKVFQNPCKVFRKPCMVSHQPRNVCSSLITCGMSILQICKGWDHGLVGRWSISSLQQQEGARLLSDPYSGRASYLKNGHIKFARHPTRRDRQGCAVVMLLRCHAYISLSSSHLWHVLTSQHSTRVDHLSVPT
jgi:hypothetical protein